jgi:hypothetical protein
LIESYRFIVHRRIQSDNWTSSLGAPYPSAVREPPYIAVETSLDFMHYSAVDNQMFVAMCSPARDMTAGYHAVCSWFLTN